MYFKKIPKREKSRFRDLVMSKTTPPDPGASGGPSGAGFIPPPPPPPPILKPSVLAKAKLFVAAASTSGQAVDPPKAKSTGSNKIRPVIPKSLVDYPGFPVKKTGQSGEEFDNEVIEYWRKWRNSKVRERQKEKRAATSPLPGQSNAKRVDSRATPSQKSGPGL